MRSATLQIGNKRYGMDDLYFEFEVPFEDSDTLQTAKFKAYNLSEATGRESSRAYASYSMQGMRATSAPSSSAR